MSDRSRLRLAVLQLLVLSLVGTLGARLWYLQVLAGDQYERIAANNGRGTIAERATRGRILDDLGRPLVTNRTSLVVSVSNVELEKLPKQERAEVLMRLGRLLKVPAGQIADEIEPCPSLAERRAKDITVCNNGSPLQPVPVATDVPEQVAYRIMEHREDFPGVEAKAVAVRAYPHKDLAAHVFGYLGRINADEIGKGRYKEGYDPSDLVGRGGRSSPSTARAASPACWRRGRRRPATTSSSRSTSPCSGPRSARCPTGWRSPAGPRTRTASGRPRAAPPSSWT